MKRHEEKGERTSIRTSILIAQIDNSDIIRSATNGAHDYGDRDWGCLGLENGRKRVEVKQSTGVVVVVAVIIVVVVVMMMSYNYQSIFVEKPRMIIIIMR